jgi:hypothetical protein
MGWLFKPYFAVPNFGGNLDAEFVQSWTMLVSTLVQRGCVFKANFNVHDSLISRGRNRLAHDFLKSDCTHLFFIDADIAFESTDVLRLIESGKPVVGGAYPKKAIGAGFNVNPLEADLAAGVSVPEADGWLEVQEIATGFLCIERSVLVRMAEEHPELLLVSDMDDAPGEPQFGFFIPFIEPTRRRYLSEDYAFCQRWRGMGGRIHCYGPAWFGHAGRHVYQGQLFSPREAA